MGKGDQKSRRGKLFKGSYGVRRKRKKAAVIPAVEKPTSKTQPDKTETVAGKETKKPSTAKKTTRPKSSADSDNDEQQTG